MRIDFARPGGVWAPEHCPGAGDYGHWDISQAKPVSGDLGGSWSPTKPINIGGAGLSSSASGTLASGGISTATGGRVVIAASANDFPQLSPTRGRTVRVPIQDTMQVPQDLTGAFFKLVCDDVNGWGTISTSPGGGLSYLAIEIPGRFMHVGARLASFAITFVVTQKPNALPSNPMQIALSSSDETA